MPKNYRACNQTPNDLNGSLDQKQNNHIPNDIDIDETNVDYTNIDVDTDTNVDIEDIDYDYEDAPEPDYVNYPDYDTEETKHDR